MGIRAKSIEVEGIELKTIEQKNEFIQKLNNHTRGGVTNDDEAFEFEIHVLEVTGEHPNACIVPLGDMVSPQYGKNFYWVIALDGYKEDYLKFIEKLGYSEDDVKKVKGERLS